MCILIDMTFSGNWKVCFQNNYPNTPILNWNSKRRGSWINNPNCGWSHRIDLEKLPILSLNKSLLPHTLKKYKRLEKLTYYDEVFLRKICVVLDFFFVSVVFLMISGKCDKAISDIKPLVGTGWKSIHKSNHWICFWFSLFCFFFVFGRFVFVCFTAY